MSASAFGRIGVWGLVFMMLVGSVYADETLQPSSPLPADSTEQHPNAVPYESDRSLGYHILATPAYVLHGMTRPIGWTVKYLERNFPGIFEPEPRPRGVLPLVELGGPEGVAGGLSLYDNHLFGTDQRIRLAALYGSRDFFEVEFGYDIPRVGEAGTAFRVEGNFFSRPEERFFVGGNESNRNRDEARFSRQQFDVTARLTFAPRDHFFSGALDLLYEHVDAGSGKGERGELLVGAPGLQPLDLLTSRLDLAFDWTRRHRCRTYAGTRMLLRMDYTHDLNGDRFRYGRYTAAIQQYVPVPFFPKTRRLALQARMEQVEPIWGGDAVPFYHRPRLGGQHTLRGFVSNRFRDDGSVLFTAEYRYPIWEQFDAVFFVDAGQVFDTVNAVAMDRFHVSYGGGFHMLSTGGLSARFEVAGSVEGRQVILTVQPAFGWSPR